MVEPSCRKEPIRNCWLKRESIRNLLRFGNRLRAGGFNNKHKGGTDEDSCVRGGLSGGCADSPKEAGHGAFRGCCSVRGGFKAQRVPCGGNPAGRGVLTMDSDYFLHLTDVGREVAEQIYEKHRRIAESGTHEKFLAKGGKYAAMWNTEQKISA